MLDAGCGGPAIVRVRLAPGIFLAQMLLRNGVRAGHIERMRLLMAGVARVGISGWRYAGWRGDFYTEGLRQRDELKYASEQFSSIEINGTFYSMQRPESFLQWKAETPDGFVFSVKGSRFITHMLKLNNPEAGLANFFAQGVLALGQKLGPILWQLPPNLGFNAEKLEPFLAALPTTGAAASKLAAKHDHRLKVPPYLKHAGVGRIRHAMEIRHSTFCCPEFLALLRKYNVASVVSDSAKKFPIIDDVTADFVYVRLHGHEVLYSGGYSDELLAQWAARVKAWQQGRQLKAPNLVDPKFKLPKESRDVFIYFDNDAKVDAPKDAMKLEALLHGKRAKEKSPAAR